MNNFLIYLKNVWDTYPIEFIVFILTILWGLILTINKHLPIRLQLNKKYLFWIKVKHTLCSINVSIKCNKLFNSSEIKNKLSNILKDSFKMINDEKGKFIFKSLKTDSTYLLEIGEGQEDNNHIVIIKNDNAFRTSKTGKILKLQDSLNELQRIINIFSKEKDDTERIMSQIKIFPQNSKGLIKDNLEIKIQEKECYISCTKEMINIVTKGIPNSKNSIKRGICVWMKYFI